MEYFFALIDGPLQLRQIPRSACEWRTPRLMREGLGVWFQSSPLPSPLLEALWNVPTTNMILVITQVESIGRCQSNTLCGSLVPMWGHLTFMSRSHGGSLEFIFNHQNTWESRWTWMNPATKHQCLRCYQLALNSPAPTLLRSSDFFNFLM